MKLRFVGDPREFEVELLERDDTLQRVRIDGEVFAVRVDAVSGPVSRVREGSTQALAARVRDTLLAAVGPLHFAFTAAETGGRRRARGLTAHEVVAPMPGKVLKVLVTPGEVVESGAPLLVLEAMKMETTLYAESPATIAKVHAAVDAMVDHGAVLIELSPPPPPPTEDPSAT
jgi:3-methylcrotonyl-CoA carboxylase alpha subunit